jgi:hypothetical protein
MEAPGTFAHESQRSRHLGRWDGPVAMGGQFNRTFVVGLAGAIIVSLGLFVLSRASGEIGDDGRSKLNAVSDCVSGQQPIARTLRSDVELIASNLPPI